jgi:hypothetical protein
MSMENTERYLQELEAIKNYAEVKRDKEKLAQENKELRANLDGALKEGSSLRSSKAKLDGAEMTLEEARLDFIRAQDAEVEKRAADRFDKLKADYESKLPQLVYERLGDTLKQPRLPQEIAKLIDTEANQKADAILRQENTWPQWFKKLCDDAVKKKVSAGLNQEFDARVETAATARAQQKLTELTDIQWPAWYGANIEPRIAELESKIYVGVFELLKGPWVLTCDRCATNFTTELTVEGIEQMLRTGQIKVACTNPSCEDTGFFSSHRHTLSVSLRDLIGIRIIQ